MTDIAPPRPPSSPSGATASCSSRSTAPRRATRSTPRSPRASPRALDELDADDELTRRRPHGRGQGLLRGDGPQGVRHRRAPVGRRPRLRRDRPARRAQAADRGDRGLRRGRRLRGRARLRPDRRRRRAPSSASPRSSARWSPPAARCCACRGGCPTAWRWSWRSPATRSAPSAATSSGVVNRLAEPGGAVDVALELAAAIARNGPLALAASKAILAAAVRLVRGGVLGQAGRALRAGLRLRGRARGRVRVQREARAGLAGRARTAGRAGSDRRAMAPRDAVAHAARHGRAPAADRGLRWRRVLDGGRQPAARRLRRLAHRGAAPARVLRTDRVGRRRPLRRALLPHVRGGGLRPEPHSLFRRDRGAAQGDPGEHLLEQDLIYVGGGSVVSLLAGRAH